MLLLKNIICQTSVRHTVRNFAKFTGRDPGIQHRKTVLAAPNEEEFVDFEELESDFMDAHKSHKQHIQELELRKEREKYLIVKQKYFKEKLPNFLTWHDKEQIRYLYRTDPEEWTIERLSEGFPALPHVIKKIATSNWTKTKQQKISNHDLAVQKNWQLFKAGKMCDLPEEITKHLNKFTNRAVNFKPFVVPHINESSIQVKNTSIGTEFSDIIRSYEQLKNQNTGNDAQRQVEIKTPKLHSGDTYLASSVKVNKQVTFSELKSMLRKKIETGKKVNEEEMSIVENEVLEKEKSGGNSELMDFSKNKYETSSGIQHFQKSERDLSHLNYPERITIPHKFYKKGFLYKLNDCYYDDDGEFLYRVPGMT